MKHRTPPLLALLALGLSLPAWSDVLLVERVQRSSQAATPARGTLMAQVEAQYGQPERKVDAVGKPPISRWVYPGFTVYFEHSHVIHAVVNKATPTEQGPRPAR